MVTGCFIKACNKVRAAGTGRARAYTEAAGQFGLACSGECRALLMPHPDPLHLAAADRITQRIKGITNQAEDLLNTDLFEHADQDVCYHLSHLWLLSLLAAAALLSDSENLSRSLDCHGVRLLSARALIHAT